MSELDHTSCMPDGVEGSQWERLVLARRRKWESEQTVSGRRECVSVRGNEGGREGGRKQMSEQKVSKRRECVSVRGKERGGGSGRVSRR